MADEATGLARHLERILALDPDAPAVEFEGRWYAYRAIAEMAHAIGARLDAAGMVEGAAVGVVLRNDPAMLAAIVALVGRGGCLVALNPHQGDERLAQDVAELALPVVVALPADWARTPLREAVRGSGSLGLSLSLSNPLSLPHARFRPDGSKPSLSDVEACGLDPARAHHAPRPGVAVEMLTSGTTGRPKRVALSLAAIAQSLLGAAHYVGGGGRRGRGSPARREPALALRRGVAIVSAPLVHIGGLWRALQCLVEGRPIALLERFEVEAWRALVRRHRPATASLVPAALRRVLEADLPREELASLRAVVCGTAPLAPEEAERFEARYGIPVLTTYGATEFAGGVAGWTLEDHRRFGASKRGSVGRAHPGCALRVVDAEAGVVVAAGEEGLLEVRSAQLEPGSGWVRTTDRAVLDADGFLFLRGRADAAIVRGGFKIHPDEVAKVLESHPAVAEAAVVGLADARLGAVPVAAVTMRPEASGRTSTTSGSSGTPGPPSPPLSPDRVPDEAELRDHARRHLAAYQVPARIRIVASLPRTPSLKVDLPAVRALFEEGEPEGRARATVASGATRARRGPGAGAKRSEHEERRRMERSNVADVLQRLVDEAEIRNLLARIAQLADEGELADYIACFTEQAIWGGAGFPERRGHEAILAGALERRASGTAGPGSQTRHLVSTALVEIEGDVARSRSIFHFYRETKSSPILDRMGVWEDTFARTAEGWKLASRTIVQPE